MSDLDSIIGTCRFCNLPLDGSPPPACAACVGLEARRTSVSVHLDPYKKVWDPVEEEEKELLSWTKNGTLFMPTFEEMAFRYQSTAHYLLGKARKLGHSVEGITTFEEALTYQRLARNMMNRHAEVLAKSR